MMIQMQWHCIYFIPTGNNNQVWVSIKFVENKRYTMCDIGKLESGLKI